MMPNSESTSLVYLKTLNLALIGRHPNNFLPLFFVSFCVLYYFECFVSIVEVLVLMCWCFRCPRQNSTSKVIAYVCNEGNSSCSEIPSRHSKERKLGIQKNFQG